MRAGGWGAWAILAVCAVIVLGAMTWLTRNVLISERDRAQAVAQADLQERVRLSLWRMDYSGTALIVEESMRPAGEVVGSIANGSNRPIKMRFTLTERGELSMLSGNGSLPELSRLLHEISDGQTPFAWLYGLQGLHRDNWDSTSPDLVEKSPLLKMKAYEEKDLQAFNNTKEQVVRNRAVENQVNAAWSQSGGFQQFAQTASPGAAVMESVRAEGFPRPLWIGKELFLLRPMTWQSAGARREKGIEGVWLDVEQLRSTLLSEIRDLLPQANLVPAIGAGSDGLVMASLPWKLQAEEASISGEVPRPIMISLLAGWIAVGLAIVAASLLVRGIMRLSERRASFVSAVTHELRTPLTTFRLYSEMLEAGAVKEEKKAEYLHVLSREADRLSHMVENVLAFSRIEQGSAREVVKETTLHELIGTMQGRFESRLEEAGMSLSIGMKEPAALLPIRVNAAVVEHILFNLVDNASKYASSGRSAVLEISVAQVTPEKIAIHVRDHGPGVLASELKRIFRAFHKSARDAAETRPGVGLGLALSRRLARSLGGDLRCERAEGEGALFVLTLPTDRA